MVAARDLERVELERAQPVDDAHDRRGLGGQRARRREEVAQDEEPARDGGRDGSMVAHATEGTGRCRVPGAVRSAGTGSVPAAAGTSPASSPGSPGSPAAVPASSIAGEDEAPRRRDDRRDRHDEEHAQDPRDLVAHGDRHEHDRRVEHRLRPYTSGVTKLPWAMLNTTVNTSIIDDVRRVPTAIATRSARAVVRNEPMYGMNPRRTSSTAIGSASGQAEDHHDQAAGDAAERRDDRRPVHVAREDVHGPAAGLGHRAPGGPAGAAMAAAHQATAVAQEEERHSSARTSASARPRPPPGAPLPRRCRCRPRLRRVREPREVDARRPSDRGVDHLPQRPEGHRERERDHEPRRHVAPTVETAAAATPRDQPRAARRSTSGSSVAALTTAISAGHDDRRGSARRPGSPRTPGRRATRPRQHHWASRSSQTGTPSGARGVGRRHASAGARSSAATDGAAIAMHEHRHRQQHDRPEQPEQRAPGRAARRGRSADGRRCAGRSPCRRAAGVATSHAATSATSTATAGSRPAERERREAR